MSFWVHCDFPGCVGMVRWDGNADTEKWTRVLWPADSDEGSPSMDFCSLDHHAGWALRKANEVGPKA